MELLQLKYFCMVAKYENMSRAGKELHIAQPAISQSIKRLEKEMGVALFDRNGKKISLNKAGDYLYKTLPNIIQSLDSLPDELKNLVQEEEHKISILVKASSCIIPTLIASYRMEHKEIKFGLLNQDTEQWDICITSQYGTDMINKGDIVLLEEEILMATDNQKFKDVNSIDLRNIKNEEFIGLREGNIFRNITDRYMNELGIVPVYSHESDNPALIREIIDALGGYAFYPEKTWGQIQNPNIKTYHIINENFRRNIVLKVNLQKDSQVLRSFIHYTINYYSNL